MNVHTYTPIHYKYDMQYLSSVFAMPCLNVLLLNIDNVRHRGMGSIDRWMDGMGWDGMAGMTGYFTGGPIGRNMVKWASFCHWDWSKYPRLPVVTICIERSVTISFNKNARLCLSRERQRDDSLKTQTNSQEE